MTTEIMKIFSSELNNTENDILPLPQYSNIGGTILKDPVGDEISFELQMHPYSVNINVLKRLSFIRFTHAICTASSNSNIIANIVLNEKNKESLQKCFTLLFKCLGDVWESIGGWSQRTLHLLIGIKATTHVSSDVYDNIFPRYVLTRVVISTLNY